MSAPKVELVKPIPGSATRGPAKGEHFDRGERLIMVDGERWGRTHVTWHGMHGTVTTFQQDGGETVQEQHSRGSDRWSDVRVSSPNKRHAKRFINHEYRLPEGFKDTDELVLEKAIELVSKGQLRPPAVVRRERDERHARFEANRKDAEREEAEAFRAKAVEATGANDPQSEIVERVIAAMRWAQSQ